MGRGPLHEPRGIRPPGLRTTEVDEVSRDAQRSGQNSEQFPMMNLLIIGAVFVGVVTLIVAVAGFVRGPANSMAESRLNLITGAATAAKGGSLITDTNLVVNLEDGTNAIERFF